MLSSLARSQAVFWTCGDLKERTTIGIDQAGLYHMKAM